MKAKSPKFVYKKPIYRPRKIMVAFCPNCDIPLEKETNRDALTLFSLKCKCGYRH